MQHVSRKKLKAEAGREDGARSFENEVLTPCGMNWPTILGSSSGCRGEWHTSGQGEYLQRQKKNERCIINVKKGGNHWRNKIESGSAAAQVAKHRQWDVLEALSKERKVRLKIKRLHLWACGVFINKKNWQRSKGMGESDSVNAFLSDWIVVNAASKTEKSCTGISFQQLDQQP